jgi:hypothetical protein
MPSGIKKQKTFAHRRHISKPRSSLGSEKEKRQSSLTQLDFVSTPRTNDVICIPSDEDEEEEEEEAFAVEQPRKRRRVSAKGSEADDWTPRMSGKKSSEKRSSAKAKKRAGLERGQQTMTQIDFVSSAQQPHIEDDIEDDEDAGSADKQDTGLRKGGSTRTLPWLNEEQDEVNCVPQSPVTDSRSKKTGNIVHQQPNLALHSIATYDFTTPKKIARHLEIPSSQSPPSIKLSSKKSQRTQRHLLGQKSPSRSPSKSPSKLNVMWRSPLMEKPANIAPLKWQAETQESQNQESQKQESQNPTMKMLHAVRMRSKLGGTLLHEEAPMPPPKRPMRRDKNGKSQATKIPDTQLAPARTLKRTTTVQDSQASDENIMTQAPPLGLHRTHTIQDSQHEDLDMSSQLYRSLSSRENLRITDSQANNDDYENNEDYYEEEDYPQTYDPVSAALDRDAARYAWTQTQAPRTQHTTRTQIADSEDETDEDDLDRGIIPDSDSEDEIILLPSASEQRGRDRSQELCSDDLVVPHPHRNDNETAKQPEEQPQQREIPNSLPSSPPLRPSQVSTIIPTQSSPQHRHDSIKRPADQATESKEGEAQELSPPSSPDPHRRIKVAQTKDTQALTISSSPLPLPPWTSSGEVDLGLYTLPKGEGKDDASSYHNTNNELASLVDFSLPPPPPLGMSSSPWR